MKCNNRIHIPKGVTDDQPCTAEQIKSLRACVGALSWLAKETRIDLAGATAFLMQSFPQPCIRDLKHCNKVLKEAIKHKDLTIVLKPIDPKNLSILVTSDAAWGNAKDDEHKMEKSQAGYVVLAANHDILHGAESPFSVLGWKSHTLKRKTVSTLGAEAQAIVESAAVASWYRYILLEIMYPERLKGFLPDWEKDTDVLEFALITDAKSVFDALSRPSTITASDKRTCIDLSLIRDLLKRNNGCVRWVDGRNQLADSLTKIMSSDFLRAAIRFGKYQLTEEYDALRLRREAKLSKLANKNSEGI